MVEVHCEATSRGRDWRSLALSLLLFLGGVPPMASGLVAALVPEVYFRFAGDVRRLDGATYPLLLCLLRLQGGDAFVGGAARVAVAVFGDLRLKRLLAVPAVAHSGFELWLLPTKLLGWCRSHPEAGCSDWLFAEVGAFMLLHAILVVGFSGVLIAPTSKR